MVGLVISHLVALAAGGLAAHLLWRRWAERWAEEHHYRRVRLEATRIRDLAVMADHDHRTALRWAGALEGLRHVHRDIVGDLLDKAADLRHQLDQADQQPQHRRTGRYAAETWSYGHRTATP